MSASPLSGGTLRTAAVRAVLAAALLASAGSLLPVVAGTAWFVEVAAVLAVLTVAAVVLDRLTAPPAVLALGQVLCAALVLTVVHVPAGAVLGIVPGPAALSQAAGLLADGLRVVNQQSAPIEATAGVRLALSAAGALVLVVLDAVVLGARRPALAGVPLLLVHAVGAVFAPTGLGVVAFLTAAAGYLAVLALARGEGQRWGPELAPRSSPPRWRPGPAPLAVALAVVVALAVPSLVALPSTGVTFGGGAAGQGSTAVNPLLDLRESLTDRSDTTVISYEVDQDDPQPLRLVTVDSFDGDLWRPPDDVAARPLPEDRRLAPPDGLAPDAATTAHRLDVTLETLRQPYLPLPYPVSGLDLAGDWQIDPTTGTVSGEGRTRTQPGQTYGVDYLQVEPDPSALAVAPPPTGPVLERYARLPDDLPPQIAASAAQVTAGATSDFERAAALQSWFRSDGGFQYTVDAPTPESPSALADFLTDQRGYCVHFASAMAVMSRTLGIPARVAVGFLPGRSTPDGWQVQASDAHAWPERWFEGVGWTRFEPTPSVQSGAAPAWTVPAAAPDDEEGGADEALETPTPSATPSEAAPAAGEDVEDAGSTDVGGSSPSRAAAIVVPVLALLGVLALVLLSPALARAWRSSARWARARREDDGALAEAAWADLVERAQDLGVPLVASDTPRRVAERVVAAVPGGAGARTEHVSDDGSAGASEGSGSRPDVAESMARLVAAVEAVRYGARPPGRSDRSPGTGASSVSRGAEGSVAVLDAPAEATGQDLRREALDVVGALRASVGVGARVRAGAWPRSGRTALARVVQPGRRKT